MNTSSSNTSSSIIASALNDPANIRRRAWRMLKDKLVRHGMTIGGLSVIAAILLIFFYLLYVVMPLLSSADMELAQQFEQPNTSAGKTLHTAIEEKNELGVRFTEQAQAIFFALETGKVVAEFTAPKPEDAEITTLAVSDPARQVVGYGLSNGRAIVMKHKYDITFSEDSEGNRVRTITPNIAYPLGQAAFEVDAQAQALTHLAVQISNDSNMVAAITADQRLVIASITKEVNFLTEEETLETSRSELSLFQDAEITHLLLDKEQVYLYIANSKGMITRFNVRDPAHPVKEEETQIVKGDIKLTSLNFLTGDLSLLVGDSTGKVTQWFLVRDEYNEQHLTRIREFNDLSAAVVAIAPEERRKGFAAADEKGNVAIYHTTAQRTLLTAHYDQALENLTLSPRADVLMGQDKQGKTYVWDVHNEHPEVSMHALWGRVWYENYPEPSYIWQSSSASADFEPKFSLMPLAFGTLKAAFYAMLVAIPLAILGAVYAAYFMSPKMRGVVKPTIEIMEALPTVILGFLAGLWLAPTIEANLPGMFSLFLLMPLVILLCAYGWRLVPKSIKYGIGEGWEAALLLIPILLTCFIAFSLSHTLEGLFFGGNMRQWLTDHGITFDQRNALIVGIAMGLAVIPSIFSITEDAIFNVPKHLTSGSLALGATRWQTMTRVVLLTASPGIFSAVMIGLGRAVGETMIVLMATGNTAIMDFNIFEGLRTLSANIAVEMPESEVGSTHFRILFLSGLVLFVLTFVFNTLAEIIRHRLRRKYSSL